MHLHLSCAAFLAAALVLLAVRDARGQGSSAEVLLPCQWLPDNGFGPGSCEPNPVWTVKNTKSTIGKTGSAFAKNVVADAVASQNCAKYNTTTPEGKAACWADRTNRCFVHWRTGVCYNTMLSYLMATKVECPGAPVTVIDTCNNLFQDECEKAPDCVWDLRLFFGDQQTLDDNLARVEDIVGHNFTTGGCYPKAVLEAVLNDDGSDIDHTKYTEWVDTTYRTKTDEDYFKQNGNCTWAQQQLALSKYQNACDELNTLYDKNNTVLSNWRGMTTSSSGLNATALAECVSRGCIIGVTLKEWITFRGPTFDTDLDLVTCDSDSQVANSLMFDGKKDGKLLKQWNYCSAPSARHSQERCEAIRVK